MRILLLVLILCPGLALAGAWQRETGSGFASATVRLGWPQDVNTWQSYEPTSKYFTLYFEYAIAPKLMLGMDLGHAVSGRSKTVAFVQFPLLNRDTGPKIGGQLGFGKVAEEKVVRPAVMFGWGMPNGWLSIDAAVELGLDADITDWKVDMTWGRNLPKGRKLLVQLQTGETSLDPLFLRVAPSVVTPLNDHLKVESGVSFGLHGDTSMGVTFGLWSEF